MKIKILFGRKYRENQSQIYRLKSIAEILKGVEDRMPGYGNILNEINHGEMNAIALLATGKRTRDDEN